MLYAHCSNHCHFTAEGRLPNVSARYPFLSSSAAILHVLGVAKRGASLIS